MTISSTTRIAGPFIGNGTASAFPFTFKVFAATDLDVIKLTVSTGTESTLVLTTDYTVSLNGDQNSNPGGTVTLTAGALASGFTLTITSDIANLQPTDLTNQGGFYPEVITDSLDRATIQIQQIADIGDRTLKIPISDGTLNMELPTKTERANSFLSFDANGLPSVVTAGSSGAPATITRQVFSGTGSQTVFTLASDPGALGNSAQVYIGGVYQQRSTYTIAGTTLTFSAAPVAGTDNIEFVNFLTSNIGSTSADLVTYTPSGSGAVARSAASKFGETVSVKDFGAVGDGVADDTAAIQAAITYASTQRIRLYVPNGKYKITATLTTPNNGYVYLVGESVACPAVGQDYTKFSTLFFAPTSAAVMIDLGTLNYFGFENLLFVSNDNTVSRTGLSIGSLGGGSAQQSSQQAVPFVISQVSFHDWGGTALSLGGETYGKISDCKFHKCAQCIAINGQGEIAVDGVYFERMENAAFSAGAGNGNAWIYVKNTVTRWINCVLTASEDFRTMVLFDDCNGCSFTGAKIEGPGRTTLSYDIIRINNTSINGNCFVFTGNAMTMSSATGNFAGRFLTTVGSLPIGILVFGNSSATYGSGVSSAVPLIDVTTNKPDHISVSGVYREASDNAVIQFADGATASTGAIYGTLAGLQGENIRYVTVSSGPFKIAASQTNAALPFRVSGRLYYYLNSLVQILPVFMEVQTDASPGDTVAIKYSLDTGSQDVLSLTSAQINNQVWFAVRDSYIGTPSSSTAQSATVTYTSGASASTATNYYFTFTYALIEDASTSNGQKFFVDA